MGKYLRRSDGRGPTFTESGPGGRELTGWHQAAVERLRSGDHNGALPLLARLVVALPSAHTARPTTLATLAHVFCEVRRFDRALVVAAEALRLDPELETALEVTRRARHGLERQSV